VDEREVYRLHALLDRSPNRAEILTTLGEQADPLRPTDIAAERDNRQEVVSRRITDLAEEGPFTVLNPEANRHRYYRITAKGNELLAARDG
jgi:DNA-binding MarR family transcriptional regulator